jgi:CheY-like chemotaxis protein
MTMTVSSGRPGALWAGAAVPHATGQGSGLSQPSSALPRPEGEPDLGKGGASGAAGKPIPETSEPKRILVIEDEVLLSMDIEASLIEAGYTVVGPAGTLERARQLVGEERLDAALVDANLSGHPVDAIVAALTRRKIPFAFVTGYGRDALPEGFREAALLSKPFSSRELLQKVRSLCAPSA